MSNIISAIKNKPEFCALAKTPLSRINQIEKEMGLQFASDYREYLQEFGIASFEGHELTGICEFPRLNVSVVTSQIRKDIDNIPSEWYVIEDTNIDGIVIWQDSGGIVYQTQPNVMPIKLYDSLYDYINQE